MARSISDSSWGELRRQLEYKAGEVSNKMEKELCIMFRDMRRKKQALSPEDCAAVLSRGTSGVLAVLGDGGYPYAVPLSYGWEDGKLYFHCAKEGHKLDAIRAEPKVSFCVIDQDEVVPLEYTTYFRSVIVFGTIHVIEDEAEKRTRIEQLAKRYTPEDSAEHRQAMIEDYWNSLCLLELTIKSMTGKEAIEIVKEKAAEH